MNTPHSSRTPMMRAAYAALAFTLALSLGACEDRSSSTNDSPPKAPKEVKSLVSVPQKEKSPSKPQQKSTTTPKPTSTPKPTPSPEPPPQPEPLPEPEPIVEPEPVPLSEPEPVPEPEPAPEPVIEDVFYANCKEAKAAGAAPLYAGEPGYRPKLDRDGDGIACER